MKIGIKFGDNDFHSTFTGVLIALNESIIYNEGSHGEVKIISENREIITSFINELSYGMYMIRQSNNGIPSEHIREYLKITSNKVFINDEVTTMISEYNKSGGNNGDFFILDTELDYENNSPVYLI